MKVILIERVLTLGNVGEIVNVTAGYARNFLFPKRLAKLADVANTKILTHQKNILAKKIEAEKKEFMDLKKKVDVVALELVRRVGANGKLFGTVTTTELARELEKLGLQIDRRQIVIENQVKGLGAYEIKVKLFQGVEGSFKINVVQDQKQVEELKVAQAEAKKSKELRAQQEAKAAEAETAEAKEAALLANSVKDEDISAKNKKGAKTSKK
ncbi:MAG: 50S ribosomal protein L9 [Bacteriovoracaceae bacterium]